MTEQKSNVVEAGEFTFHVFDRIGTTRADHVPTVRIQKSGEIHINEPAIELIGKPQAVELLYDPQNNALGIRPSDTKTPYAFPRRRDKQRPHVHIFAGRSFTLFHGIDTSNARRFPAKLVDGILVADLNAGVDTGSGHSNPRGEESDTEGS